MDVIADVTGVTAIGTVAAVESGIGAAAGIETETVTEIGTVTGTAAVDAYKN